MRIDKQGGCVKRSFLFLLVCLLLLRPVKAAAAQTMEDGQYTVAVNLSGGFGRASVTSLATLTVNGGEVLTLIEWSSPHYRYMLVDDVRYDPLSNNGNSTFEILVRLDEEIPISAETCAMSQPHLIDYTLYFDSTTLQANAGPKSNAYMLAAIASCAIFMVFLYIKKRGKGK